MFHEILVLGVIEALVIFIGAGIPFLASLSKR